MKNFYCFIVAVSFWSFFINICISVYPVPGSYYSVLLRFNRGKSRKEGRTAPSPHRLWAYFDPPAPLGAFPLEALDNNIAKRYSYRPFGASSVKANENYDQEYKTTFLNKKNHQHLKNKKRGHTETPWYQTQKMEKQQIQIIEKQQQHQQQQQQTMPQYRSASETINTQKIDMKEVISPQNPSKKLYQKNKKIKTKNSSPAEYKNDFSSRNHALKNASHALDEKISQKLGTKFSQRKDDLKNQFKTASLPIAKGTCGSYKKLLLSPSVKHKKRFFKETVQTIGFPDTYKEEEKCNWIFEVGDECQMGMIAHEIHEGNLLQSRDCSIDFLSFTFNDGKHKKVCGSLTNHSQSYLWTTSQRQILNITMVTKERSNDTEIRKPLGFLMTVSGYCWLYSASHLSKLLKNKRRDRKEPPKFASKTNNEKQKNIVDIKIINEDRKDLNASIKNSREGLTNNASISFQNNEFEGKKTNMVKNISEIFKVTINGKLKGRIYEIQDGNERKLNKEEEEDEKEKEEDRELEQEVHSTPASSLVFRPLFKRKVSNGSLVEAKSKSSERSETNSRKDYNILLLNKNIKNYIQGKKMGVKTSN